MRRTLGTTMGALTALGLAATATLCLAQAEPIKPVNQGSYTPPPRTEKGTWDGTWFYVSRDAKIALWIRSGDDIEVRMRYQSVVDTESFETDWNGDASYAVRGRPAEVHLDLTEADANLMRADWRWSLEGDDARRETANLSVYRTGDGRRLVFLFEDFLKVLRVGEREMHITAPHGWTFVKASKRHVSWGEVPF